MERGRYAEAVEELSTLLVEHPLRERVCDLFVTVLYGAGRQSDAVTIYLTTSHLPRQLQSPRFVFRRRFALRSAYCV
ncbi:BTAD domain-containing putative transcriptional regulator [Streptomyces chiangmaiensis]|uniref:BTAD domain-containing putative transcriptional regulator n=1 Tax=Streptomyces chiangmaiensis TaxID=766497 RepID=A0ABU7FYI2_9ACTN|nr:BTAD domain-containing putative transcriptional regulator [Streptomyces chiangmaiensis]MED7829079.1 BTAD domain-containing putative transcriptional regulator [Streptomyces chiangmaiensis]